MKLTICEAWDLLRKIRADQEQAAQPAEKETESFVIPPPVNLPPTLDDVAGPGYRVIPPTPDLPKIVGDTWIQYTEVPYPVSPYFFRGNGSRLWFAISVINGSIVLATNEVYNGNPIGINLWTNIELQQFHVRDWGTIVTQDWWIHCSNVANFTIIEGITK
jgi:hypothetical protein